MLWHIFTLPLTKDMEKILLYYGASPMQLPHLIVLVYKWAKILERLFSKKFSYEVIITIIEILKPKGIYIPSSLPNGGRTTN